MRAVVVSRYGGPDELVVTDLVPPSPGPGEIAVEVSTAAVNYLDIYHRTGHYQKPTPFTPGVEGAGRVIRLGRGVSGLDVGNRVAWALCPGTYAEQMVIPAARVVPIPDAVPDELAAAGLLHGMSARYLTASTFPVGPGVTVLVQGALFGTRLLLVQLAKARGARVIATVAGRISTELAVAAGADEVISWEEGPAASRVRELTGGHGVDVVYDGIGRLTFGDSLACLRPRGTFVQVAEVSGPVEPFDPTRLTSGSFMYCRPVLSHYIARRGDLLKAAAQVFEWITDGTLTIRPGDHFRLGEAGAAQLQLEAGLACGKPLIVPGL